MKKKISDILEIIFVIALMGLVGYLFYQNDRLTGLISEQNSFIKEVTGKDSVFIGQSKKYQDSLKKFTDKLSFYLDDRKVTSDEFINAYKKLERERDSLKSVYDLAKRTYGFKMKYIRREHYLETSAIPYTKADSASVALYYFHDRLKVTKQGWIIDTTGPEDLKKFTKEIQEALKGRKKPLDTSKLKPSPVETKDSIK